MSEGNIELVRRTIDLVNATEIDRALEELADDFEMDWSNSIGPLKGIYRGRQEVLKLWRTFLDAWDAVQWDPEEIIEVDESRVIAVNHVRARGRGSGAAVDSVGALLYTISDGKARSIKLFQSKAEALEAVGLEE